MTGDDGGLVQGLEALGRFLAGSDSLDEMLTKITLVATESIPGCDLASITVLRDGVPSTPAASDKTATELDEAQYQANDGPCLAALRHRGVETADIELDRRWPAFDQAAMARGVVGVLSVPFVSDEDVRGGLNLYSRMTRVFSADAVALAERFGDQLGLATANLVVLANAAELADQLELAMESRATIEQAKGIIMAANRCSPEAAFDILRQASQNQNRKLRDIAHDIVERTQDQLPR